MHFLRVCYYNDSRGLPDPRLAAYLEGHTVQGYLLFYAAV